MGIELECEYCNALGAVKRRQNTAYVDDELNWKTLCPECQEENDKHWKDMWLQYYYDCL